MRAYELTYAVEGNTKKKYADTQKDARTLRREIMAEASLKIGDVNIEQIEIPTKKSEFLPWLNSKLA